MSTEISYGLLGTREKVGRAGAEEVGRGGGSGTYVILLPSAPTGRSKYLKTAPNHQNNSCQGDGEPASAKQLYLLCNLLFQQLWDLS